MKDKPIFKQENIKQTLQKYEFPQEILSLQNNSQYLDHSDDLVGKIMKIKKLSIPAYRLPRFEIFLRQFSVKFFIYINLHLRIYNIKQMGAKVIPIALLCLVLAQSQLLRVEDSKKPGGGGGWPPKPTCAFKHTIYAVDRSGSMSGPSWERVQQFLAGSNILAQYKSLFSFYLTWPAVAQIQDYYTIAWNPVLPPTMYLPNGGANYDDALHRASQILSQNFPTSTCLILLSDGWQSSTQSYLDEFIAAKNDFTKKTGCPVCVMCYLTMISHWGKTPFEKMCEALKAPVFQLEKAVEFKGPKISTQIPFPTQPPIDVDPGTEIQK